MGSLQRLSERDPGAILRALQNPAALDAATRDAFARHYAQRAVELGLTYLTPDGPRPIPAAFPPLLEPKGTTTRRSGVARSVTVALARTARAVLDGNLGPQVRQALLSELEPAERERVLATYRSIDHLATVRVDMFTAPDGVDRVLEVNATIPAMQGYSDAAARAVVEAALCELGGRTPAQAAQQAEKLMAPFGSNADDLLASLLACYRARGGELRRPALALVHRTADSQLGELASLAEHFRRRGFSARTVEAGQVALDGQRMIALGQPVDVLYRHIFLRRVETGSDLDRILARPGDFAVFNPVDPHLEQKSLLAELSACSVEPSLAARAGLTASECSIVRRHVPWTRRIAAGPATLPEGKPVSDLLELLRVERGRFVVKKSWDFGGKSVFLGAEHGDAGSLLRSKARFGSELSWAALVEACAAEGGWIAQERVATRSRPLLLADRSGATETEGFVDVSAYTGLGAGTAAGGVCRASGSPIVNIQSGGGVLPLLAAELAR